MKTSSFSFFFFFFFASLFLTLSLVDHSEAYGDELVKKALWDLKNSLSSIQAKITSDLWGELGIPLDEALQKVLNTNSASFLLDDLIEVEIIGEVADALLDFLEENGVVDFVSRRFRSISASVPASLLEIVAAYPGVIRISRPGKARTLKSNTSQGVASHRVDVIDQEASEFTGQGVKVGVLSDSVNFLNDSIASGDLPPVVTVLDDLDGTGEGTAMLEIVHDMAPGAELFFATAFRSEASFAENIIALADAGCQVITDDVYYYAEEVYSDGTVAQAVDEVAQRGVFYFSSAGNSGSFIEGNSEAWEGNYIPGPLPSFLTGYLDVQLFSNNNDHLVIAGVTGQIDITLHWADNFYSPEADYDLFITNNTGYILGSSINKGFAYEIVSLDSTSPFSVDYTVYVARASGSARMLSIRMHALESTPLLSPNTNGVLFGHTAAKGAFSIAAIQAHASGSFFETKESGGFLVTESFSSQGPRRVFFENGVPITPGNFNSTGGELRLKPDFTAADGVSTATPGFNPFFGTSAAAPHGAGLLARLLSEFPGLSIAQLREVAQNTTLDILDAGWDDLAGVGVFDAVLLRNGILVISVCDPNPCAHGGICKPDPPSGFSCDCSQTGYSGPFCDEGGPPPSLAYSAERPSLAVVLALLFLSLLSFFYQ